MVLCHSVFLRYTYWNDCGYYQSNDWSEVGLLKPFPAAVLSQFVV